VSVYGDFLLSVDRRRRTDADGMIGARSSPTWALSRAPAFRVVTGFEALLPTRIYLG
jgi:hypothetical protein